MSALIATASRVVRWRFVLWLIGSGQRGFGVGLTGVVKWVGTLLGDIRFTIGWFGTVFSRR